MKICLHDTKTEICHVYIVIGRKKRESGSHESLNQRKLSGNTAWQTLVLFAVNFKRLNVHMNMGNVMGNVT